MNDFTFMKKMNEEDAYLFKRCIRKMLDTTFIVADKDEKLYDFISSESNQYDVNTYLAAIGYCFLLVVKILKKMRLYLYGHIRRMILNGQE